MSTDDVCRFCEMTRGLMYEESMGMYCPNSANGMHEFGKVLEPGSHYVVGFAFSLRPSFSMRSGGFVLLISKKRPIDQVGKLNGVGGKVEDEDVKASETTWNATPYQVAMAREWNEEVGGIQTIPTNWTAFCCIRDVRGWDVTYYFADVEIGRAEQKTDEQVLLVNCNELTQYPVIPNIHWLIPMALTLHSSHPLSKFTDSAWFFNIEEVKRG